MKPLRSRGAPQRGQVFTISAGSPGIRTRHTESKEIMHPGIRQMVSLRVGCSVVPMMRSVSPMVYNAAGGRWITVLLLLLAAFFLPFAPFFNAVRGFAGAA